VNNISGVHVYVEQRVPRGSDFFNFKESVQDLDAAVPLAMTVEPTSRFAYFASKDSIQAFTINATSGELSAVQATSPFAAGKSPYWVATGP